MKRLALISAILFLGLSVTTRVSAHVSVNPKEVAAGYSVAVIRVPNEKDHPTVQVRVVVPSGTDIAGVMPISGWTHTEKREISAEGMKDEDGHASEATGRITEITWSGGQIREGEFMEFPVSVKYPESAQDIVWKAYQTYQGGEIVAWDGSTEKNQAPKVKVMSGQSAQVPDANQGKTGSFPADTGGNWMSAAAVILSLAALAVSIKKR